MRRTYIGGTGIFMLLLLSLYLQGCLTREHTGKGSLESIRVEVPEKPQLIGDSALFCSGEVVFLEAREESLIGSVKKVQLTSGGIYVHDWTEQKLLLFSRDGRYISKIEALGRGPQEYILLTDFYVDEKNERVVTYHNNPNKIMFYDLNLNFKDAINLSEEMYYSDFVIKSDSLIWKTFTSDSKHEVAVSRLSAPGEVTYLLNKKDDTHKWEYFNRLSLIKTCNVNITRNFDYTIYQLRNGDVVPSYRFDFAKNTLPPDYRKSDVFTDVQKQLEVNRNRYIYTIGAVHESKGYLMFLTNLEGFFVLDKTDGDVNFYRAINSSEYMMSLNERNLIPLNNSENKICFDLLKPSMSSRERYLTDAEYKTAVDEKYTGSVRWKILNLNDNYINPVLLFYTFKK